MSKMNLRVKVLLSVGLIIFVVLGASTIVHIQDLKRNYLETIAWRSEAFAQEILTDLVKSYNRLSTGTNVRGLLEVQSLKCEQLYEANQAKQVSHFAVIDETGMIVAHNDRALRNTPITSPLLQASLQRRKIMTVLDGSTYHTLVPVFPSPEVYIGAIDVGVPASLVAKKVREVLLQSVGLFLLCGVLACVGASVLVHLVLIKPITQLVIAAQKIANGELTHTIRARKGADEITELTEAFQNMIVYLQDMAQAAARIATGDFSQDIPLHSQEDRLGHAFRNMTDALKNILREIDDLIQAVQEGKLTYHSHVERFAGDWQHLVRGLNNVIDGFVAPITLTAEYLARIARGDIPEVITAEYKGDFTQLKDHLNVLIAAERELTGLAEKMAGGNLAIEVQERSQQDSLMRELNTMLTKLNETVIRVKNAAYYVAQGSLDMNTVAEQVSQGASQQAAASEEVSSSMEQMVANIRQNMENAQMTEKMAMESSDDAQKGGIAVSQTIDAMKAIAERISIIQEIAVQTNILSLNATIEASKAQDFGKGFGVVASEVRALAGRTREAAEEIERLVRSCEIVSAEAGNILQRLVPNSRKTTELIQEISAASNEQYIGVEQINKAIQQLDTVIQQNAATAEEMASAAEELTSQSQQLQQTMALFTVREPRQPVLEQPSELINVLHNLLSTPTLDEQQLARFMTQLLAFKHKGHTLSAPGQHEEAQPSPVPAQRAAAEVTKPLVETARRDALDDEFERY